jgi:hypothetical protein
VNDLGKIYKRTRQRAKRSLQVSNKEVNRYVEELGKTASTQQQETATLQPTTEKSNGKEDSGTKKPN